MHFGAHGIYKGGKEKKCSSSCSSIGSSASFPSLLPQRGQATFYGPAAGDQVAEAHLIVTNRETLLKLARGHLRDWFRTLLL